MMYGQKDQFFLEIGFEYFEWREDFVCWTGRQAGAGFDSFDPCYQTMRRRREREMKKDPHVCKLEPEGMMTH